MPHTPQENLPAPSDNRKRKDVSPAGKSGPLSKRAAAGAKPAAAVVTATATAPSGRVAVPAEDNIWEAVAEETGWTPADCLGHKLSFAKRSDAKARVEALAAHVKRLRAAGWHLLEARERLAGDAEAAAAGLAREEAARREDREQADAALRSVQGELGALGLQMKQHEGELSEQRAQVRAAVCGSARVSVPLEEAAGQQAYA